MPKCLTAAAAATTIRTDDDGDGEKPPRVTRVTRAHDYDAAVKCLPNGVFATQAHN